ncbi:MAG TPA: class I SAM-dependent methyltransferase [Acidimicrobiales bacterium]|jgi:SAM-dependent methyltransferase|nr:class I SAM-dependent methyltransferase [Acidimicrobiales bacterium]
MDGRVYQQMEAVEDRHWWFLGRRAVIASVLTDLPPGRVLDAGCGSGGNLSLYAALGPVFGVDTVADPLVRARRRGYQGVGVASLPCLPFADGAFDLVAATDVVEHVADGVGALRELLRVTRPGGRLLITVPAYRWLWSDSDVQLGHHRRYTRPELVEQCRAAGAQVIRATYFNTTLLAPIAAVRWARTRSGKPMAATELEQTGPVANRLLRLPMVAEARLIGAGISLPAGVSIVCLAAKPGRAPEPAPAASAVRSAPGS